MTSWNEVKYLVERLEKEAKAINQMVVEENIMFGSDKWNFYVKEYEMRIKASAALILISQGPLADIEKITEDYEKSQNG